KQNEKSHDIPPQRVCHWPRGGAGDWVEAIWERRTSAVGRAQRASACLPDRRVATALRALLRGEQGDGAEGRDACELESVEQRSHVDVALEARDGDVGTIGAAFLGDPVFEGELFEDASELGELLCVVAKVGDQDARFRWGGDRAEGATGDGQHGG